MNRTEFPKWGHHRLSRKNQRGAGLMEYALALALIVVVTIVTFAALGGNVKKALCYVNVGISKHRLPNAATASSAGEC